MPRVLIPTDEPNFTLGLVEGYRSLGWEVVTGAGNLKTRSCHYDAIHYQWPEEYSDWRIPTREQLAKIKDDLNWWSKRARNIFTVHNLYPHNGIGDPAYQELYSYFYRHCDLISHFSNASRSAVLGEFPAARNAFHVVHCPPNYEVTLKSQKQRGSRRAEFGIGNDAFVILVIGRLRSWEEVRLVRQAFDLADIPNKRLLMAGKLALNSPSSRISLDQLSWKWWLKRRNAVVDTRYVSEDEVSRFVDSCDVAIVPRFDGLASAIPYLAMTFGRMVIAPNTGAYPEYFAGTGNLLYSPGDPASFALKLEEASKTDSGKIGAHNAQVAANWSWREICEVCLQTTVGTEGD